MNPSLLSQPTALLFFTRTASSEAASKSFVHSKNKKTNYKISSLLIQTTRKTVLESGLPVFEINNSQQTGNCFGEKISNAVLSVFDQGFENVIVLGNDCPQLTISIIKNAAARLLSHQIVLGPDNNGGVYLIGISKKVFNKESFIKLRWQTSFLFDNIRESFLPNSHFTLPVLKDVNDSTDLETVSSLLPISHILKCFVISLLASFFNSNNLHFSGFISQISFLFGLRAPPSLI